MDDDPPAAYLFGNGNAMFFDEAGEQISEMQRHGLSGVHLFRAAYPEAPVYGAIWNGDAAAVHENVYDHITEPDDS